MLESSLTTSAHEMRTRVEEREREGPKAHLRESPADGAGLLGAEVEGQVLLVLVKFSDVLALLLVHDRENTGDGLANTIAVVREEVSITGLVN